MPLFEVELPDGRILEIERPDQAAAFERARQFLAAERGPQEDNRPLQGGFAAFGQGLRSGFGSPFQGVGGVGEAVGLPGAGYVRDFGNWVAGNDPRNPDQNAPTRGVELRDFRSQPLSAVAALGGEVAGNLAGLIGTGIGTGLMARMGAKALGTGAAGVSQAGRVGTVGGVAGAGIASGQPELEGALIAEGVSPERALTLSAAIGPLIGAGEVAGPIAMVQRVLGRRVSEAAARTIVEAGLRRSVIREGTFGAGTEALSEALGDTARQAVVAAETGNLDLGRRAEQVAIGAIGGALGGGAIGAPLGAVRHNRAQQQVAAEEAGRPPPPPAPPEPEAFGPAANIVLPPEPEAFTTPEEAAAFIQQTGRRPAIELDGDNLVQHANIEARRQWQGQTAALRREAIDRFLGTHAVIEQPGLPTEDGKPTTQRQTEQQVAQLVPRLYAAANQGEIDLAEGFTAQQVAEVALQAVEGGVESAYKTEVAATHRALDALVEANVLKRKGTKYVLAPATDTSGRRTEAEVKAQQMGQGAPPTGDQRAAALAEQWLGSGQLLQASDKQVQAALGQLAKDSPRVASTVQQIVQNTNELSKLEAKSRGESTGDEKFDSLVLEADNLREMQANLLQQQARLTEVLRGYGLPGAMQAQPTEVDPETLDAAPPEVRHTQRAEPKFGEDVPPEQQQMFQEAAQAKQSMAQWRQFLADPRLASLLNGMLVGSQRTNMNLKAWQQAFQEAGVPLSDQQAADVNAAAQRVGVTNRLGMLMKPPVPFQVESLNEKPAPKGIVSTQRSEARGPEENPSVQEFNPDPEGVRDEAQQAALAVNGRVIWDDGQHSIVEVFDSRGQMVYFPVVGDKYFTKNIEGMRVSPDYAVETKELMDRQLAAFKAMDAEKARVNPGGPFGQGRFAKTENFSAELFNYGQQLIKMLGLPEDVRVLFVSQTDALSPDFITKNNLYGNRFMRFRDAARPLNTNMGELFPLEDGKSFAIFLKDGMRPSIQLETMAHEVGHIFERTAFNSAPQDVRNEIYNAHVKWLRANRGKDAIAFIEALRPMMMADVWQKSAPQFTEMPADQLAYYWHSFSEWMADQTARWATTDAEPQSLLDKFFSRIAEAYKKIVATLRPQLAPDETVAKFIQAYRNGQYRSPNMGTYFDTASQPAMSPPPAPAAKATSQRLLADQITGTMKWVASPITTMPALRPALKPAADVQHTLAARRSTVLQSVEGSLKEFLALKPEAQTRVTKVWEQASRTRKAPPYAAMDPKEASALKQLISGPQAALNFYIESATWNHFDPAAAKTPQQKAKLEAFWQKHAGEHLWEIPVGERRAASPLGASAMVELERLRNPFYMPMLAQGSHFVAAYELDAKGQRKGGPVRMYAFTPRNAFQRMMKFDDPQAKAVEELQREFGGKAKYELQTEAVQFNSDQQANDIRNRGDFISQYLEQLSNVSGMKTQEAQRILSRMTDQINKAQLERIFRPNQDILRPITSYNEKSYVMDVMPRYFAGMASMVARRHTQEMWARAIKPLSVNDKDYLNNLRDYSTTPTEAFGGLRTLAFVWLMGFAPDTAFVNALQVVQVTLPLMVRDGGAGAAAHVWKANGEVLKHAGKAFRKWESVAEGFAKDLSNPDEKAAVTRAVEVGTMSPLYTDESRGQVTVAGMRPLFGKRASVAADKLNSTVRIAGVLQQSAEQMNRMTTFLAAYRMAKADPSVIGKSNTFNKTNIDSTKPDAAYQYATKMVQDSQYVTTKDDRAYFQRFTPGAELMTQFMSFPAKTVELFARHFLKVLPGAVKDDPAAAKAGALGFMLMLAPMIGLAGVWSLPFAESLREIFEKITTLAWGSTQNFDADMKRWMGGGTFAEFMTRGGPHAAGIVSLSRRLAIDPIPYQELTTTSALSLLGPAASIPEAYARAAERAKHGDYLNMLALMFPRAAGNLLRGVDLAVGTGEYRSDKGRTLVSQEQLAARESPIFGTRGPLPVAGFQLAGFQVPDVANARDRVLRGEELDRQNLKTTESLNSEVARYMTEGLRAQQRGDMDAAQREFNAMSQRLQRNAARNLDFINNQRYDLMVEPNMGAIRRRALEDFRGLSDPGVILQRTGPNRRLRAAEESQLYS